MDSIAINRNLYREIDSIKTIINKITVEKSGFPDLKNDI